MTGDERLAGRVRRRAWRLARTVIAIYLGVVLVFSLLERRLVYPAPRLLGADWVAADLPHEDLYFAADDGTKLHGWYVPCPNPRGAILFCHGNGEDVAKLKPALAILRDFVGAAAFAWDYRGYGRSEGSPNEANTIADARAAQLVLAQQAGVRPEEVVVLGRSLGGGVAIGLAEKFPIRGLVLDRTFTELVATARLHFPWLPVRWMMRNRYRSIDRIRNYRGPLLQTHGTDDEVVPFAMGRELFEAAASPQKRFIPVEGGTHNSATPMSSFAALRDFLDELNAQRNGSR